MNRKRRWLMANESSLTMAVTMKKKYGCLHRISSTKTKMVIITHWQLMDDATYVTVTGDSQPIGQYSYYLDHARANLDLF